MQRPKGAKWRGDLHSELNARVCNVNPVCHGLIAFRSEVEVRLVCSSGAANTIQPAAAASRVGRVCIRCAARAAWNR